MTEYLPLGMAVMGTHTGMPAPAIPVENRARAVRHHFYRRKESQI